MSDHDEQLSDIDINRLMEAYDSLETFSDVNRALNQLAADPTLRSFIFSNGTKTMISNSVLRSNDLSPHAGVFEDIITVDEVQRYKPSKESYLHLATQVGDEDCQMRKIWLVSSNPFDVVGARSMDMNAIWVDRVGGGWKDAAAPDLRPTAVVNSLEQIVEEIRARRQ